MNKEDIIRMARDAGFVIDEKAQQHQPNCIFHTYHMVDELLERFAALVAAAERERCARIIENEVHDKTVAWRLTRAEQAAAIRAKK
jgi:hypothetical protein